MAELIRKDDLLAGQYASNECHLQENKDRHLDVYKRGWNDALQSAYDNAPAVDAVEVVRCRDCKHLFEDDGCPLRYFKTHVEEDFCSYGERKNDV